jgi:hypothetical protein
MALIAGMATLACGGGGGGGGGGSKAAGTGGASLVGGSSGTGGAGGSGGTQADAGLTGTGGGALNADAKLSGNVQDASKVEVGATVGTCPTFTACGGDLVGTWRLVSECLSATTSGPCATTRTTMDISAYDLRFTFAANGSATVSMSGVIRENFRYSDACLGLVGNPDAGIAANCDYLRTSVTQSFQKQGDAGGPPFELEKFECAVDAPETCACDTAYRYPNVALTGSYTVEGNQIVTLSLDVSSQPGAPSGGTSSAERLDYCISGNTLTLRLGSTGDSTMTFVR